MLNGLKNGYPPPGDVEDKYFQVKGVNIRSLI